MSLVLSQLPSEITLFDSISGVDISEFKAICFQVGRELNLAVQNVWKSRESKTDTRMFTYDNYHAVKLDSTWVLCNRHFPYVGFTNTLQASNKTFIENPRLSRYFSNTGRFEVLNADFLNQAFVKHGSTKLLTLLDENELQNILHWSPTKVGDAIFNEWD